MFSFWGGEIECFIEKRLFVSSRNHRPHRPDFFSSPCIWSGGQIKQMNDPAMLVVRCWSDSDSQQESCLGLFLKWRNCEEKSSVDVWFADLPWWPAWCAPLWSARSFDGFFLYTDPDYDQHKGLVFGITCSEFCDYQPVKCLKPFQLSGSHRSRSWDSRRKSMLQVSAENCRIFH